MKTITTTTGEKFDRLSDWIEIYHREIIGGYVSYFDFDGITYSWDEIIRLGTDWASEPAYDFIECGSYSSIIGVVATLYFSPIYVELDEYCDHVRVYEKERIYELE